LTLVLAVLLIGLANYVRYFSTPSLFNSIFNSVWVALVTTIIVIPLAFSYAYALTRSQMRFKGLFYAAAMLPLFAPSLLSAISLIYIFGNQGFLKGWLMGAAIYGPIGIGATLSPVLSFRGNIGAVYLVTEGGVNPLAGAAPSNRALSSSLTDWIGDAVLTYRWLKNTTLAVTARSMGVTVVGLDCRSIEPTERGFLHSLSRAIGSKARTAGSVASRITAAWSRSRPSRRRMRSGRTASAKALSVSAPGSSTG
jgi:hypothetical protein